MTPSEIRAHVGGTDFERVRAMLAKAFRSGPSPEPVDDEMVAQTIESEWSARDQPRPNDPERIEAALSFLAAAPAGWTPPVAAVSADALTYYDGRATHERSEHEIPSSAFVNVLPMVRMSLPDAPPSTTLLARTAIGRVQTQDHLLTSVSAVRERMKQLGPEFDDVTRVDLVTPARVAARFGAIGLYLGYRPALATPSFYILEAGLASGPSVRLFPSKDLGKILDAPTAYRPTPFTEMSNCYDGELTLAGDHPTKLVVQSFRQPKPPVGWRVQVTVEYLLRDATTVRQVAPSDLTLLAATRIAAIARARDETAIDLQDILGPAGERLDWIQKPKKATP